MRVPRNILKHVCFKPSVITPKQADGKAAVSPTIFLHGYLGSRKTFTKLSRHLTNALHCQTYSLDLRNHGDSFHAPDVSYDAMVRDVEDFIDFHHYEIGDKVNLVGYSMGAKVALNFAFNNKNAIDKLVCIDNAPVSRFIPREMFNDIIGVMRELEGWKGPQINAKTWRKVVLSKIKTKLNDDDALSLYVLDNFKFNETLHQVRLKVPGYILSERTLDLLGEFPIQNDSLPENVKALFIKASESGFIDNEAVKRSSELIGDLRVKEFEGSHHGVFINHYEEIERLIEDFLSSK